MEEARRTIQESPSPERSIQYETDYWAADMNRSSLAETIADLDKLPLYGPPPSIGQEEEDGGS